MEVFIAIDAVAPHQVKYRGVAVVAGSDRLIVQPDRCNFQDLQKAKEIADRALDKLPVTPVMAAGINIRYTCPEFLDALQQTTRQEWLEKQLSDNKYEIVGRSLSRSLKWRDGQVNFSVTEEADGKCKILFNFDRGSRIVSDLRAWLTTPIADIESEVHRVLFDCMQLKMENIEYATATAET